MKKIGKMGYPCEESYYSDNFVDFFYENGEKLSDDDLNYWAVCLNSPWDNDTEGYVTKVNKLDKTKNEWMTIYQVIGYEGITSEICGYGDDPASALNNCICNFRLIQEIYNKNGEYF